jgi:hypothetical protein
MGEEAYRTVTQRFPLEKMVRKYNALLGDEDFAADVELM